ncbi:peptidylprolyl isomerase [endosymbiont of Sipalinus gigas]|nr:peptidylprolyl isomerase [endosymbiont of Sipalinus gigas]
MIKQKDFIIKINNEKISADQTKFEFDNEIRKQSYEYGFNISDVIFDNLNNTKKNIIFKIIKETLLSKYYLSIINNKNNLNKNEIDKLKIILYKLYNRIPLQTDIDNNEIKNIPKHYNNISINKISFSEINKHFKDIEFYLPNEDINLLPILSQDREIRLANINVKKILNNKNISEDEILKYYNENKPYSLDLFKIKYIFINKKNIFDNININENFYIWFNKIKKKYSNLEKNKKYVILNFNSINDCKLASNLLKKNKNILISEDNISKELKFNKIEFTKWIDSDNNFFKNFNLNNIGEISNIFKHKNYYVLLQLIDICNKKIISFNDFSEKNKNIILNDYKLIEVNKLFNYIYNKIYDNKYNEDLIKYILNKYNFLKIEESLWFNKKNIPRTINSEIINRFSFFDFCKKLLKNKKNNIFLLNSNSLILIDEILNIPPKIMGINESRKDIYNNIMFNNINKLENEILNLCNKGDENKAKEKYNFCFSKPETINFFSKKFNYISDIIFSMSMVNNKSNYKTKFLDKENLILISLDKIKNKYINKENKHKIIYENIFKSILNNVVIDLLVSNLIKKSDITVNDNCLNF